MIGKAPIPERQFEILFREHFTPLCYFAKKYLGDIDSSKEIVHAVFVKIWENRAEFEFDKPAKSYLYTAVYNRSMNFLRDRKKFVYADDDNQQIYLTEAGHYSDTIEVAELESKIHMGLGKLPEKCRQIFELNRFEGKKYAEIAQLLSISIKTVETQMSKALRILKEELKDYLYLFILFFLKNSDYM